MSIISIAVPIYITAQFTKGIYLLYIVTNPPTTNILATELIIGEKYIPSICYIYITLRPLKLDSVPVYGNGYEPSL